MILETKDISQYILQMAQMQRKHKLLNYCVLLLSGKYIQQKRIFYCGISYYFSLCHDSHHLLKPVFPINFVAGGLNKSFTAIV